MATLEEKSKYLDSGFAQVPNFAIFNSSVSMEARFLYTVLVAFAWYENKCYPGQKRLAEILNKSTDYVQKLLKELKLKNFISWKRRGLRVTNLYTLNIRNREWNGSKLKPSASGIQIPPDNGTNYTKLKNTKFNNYPERKSKTENSLLRGTESVDNPIVSSKPESNLKAENRVTLFSQLKKIREQAKVEAEEAGLDTNNLKTASDAIVYYEECYQKVTGITHPRYKSVQLNNCFTTFALAVIRIKEEKLSMDILFEAINYWFSTTKHEPNNLLLNHFAGGESNITIDNCIDAVAT